MKIVKSTYTVFIIVALWRSAALTLLVASIYSKKSSEYLQRPPKSQVAWLLHRQPKHPATSRALDSAAKLAPLSSAKELHEVLTLRLVFEMLVSNIYIYLIYYSNMLLNHRFSSLHLSFSQSTAMKVSSKGFPAANRYWWI